jgi:hypothetical protein
VWKARAAIQALAPVPAVPEGWKLVPIEPTEAMESAAMAYVYTNGFTRGAGPSAVYAAMLSAAPKPAQNAELNNLHRRKTMSKHTPGPWTWQEGDGNEMPKLIAGDKEVCNFGDDTTYYPSEGEPPNDADASLIAAAPELLEALEWCADTLAVFVDDGTAALDSVIGKNLTAARAAIAKARGELFNV